MLLKTLLRYTIIVLLLLNCFEANSKVAAKKTKFKIIAFYTAKNDLAHISFVEEANKWFPKMAEKYHFSYESTNNWNNLNSDFLSKYQLVIFLDTRPEIETQRIAFQKYMENGGAWIGFHFSAFALNDSDYSQNWDWYHNFFLGAGQYKSNTWHPTSAIARVEDNQHTITKKFSATFKTAPNEWYSWENDLRLNPNIKILLSIDDSSFPLGNGPKQHEIWKSGYYPVVWTNTKFKMIYINMGHNDMDYDGGTNKTLSSTFSSEFQNKLFINALLWLGNNEK
jgi:uncharacterized protein